MPPPAGAAADDAVPPAFAVTGVPAAANERKHPTNTLPSPQASPSPPKSETREAQTTGTLSQATEEPRTTPATAAARTLPRE